MLDLEIRERIGAYVAGDLSAAELEDWLEDASWDVAQEPTRSLAATVLRLLAEHGNGDWTEAELGARLGHVGRTYWFESAPKTTLTGTDAALTQHGQWSPLAGRRRAAESA